MKNKDTVAITVKDLHVYYKDIKRFSLKKKGLKGFSSNIFKAVKGVSFEIKKGEIIGICGKNGSGKSTVIANYISFYGLDDVEYICPDIYASELFGTISDIYERYKNV